MGPAVGARMKKRPTLLARPESANHRYWSATVDGVEHHFRFPSWSVAEVICAVSAEGLERCGIEGTATPAQWRRYSPWACVVIGACWHHLGKAMEPETPPWSAEKEDWLAFGAAVADDLQDSGYAVVEMAALYNRCAEELAKRRAILTRADEMAAFSDGGAVGTPAEVDASPTQPEPGAMTTSPSSAA